MKEKNVSVFYEKDSKQYDARWNKRGGLKTTIIQKNIVSSFIEQWSDKRIIELGCGTGRFSVELVAKGQPTILFDLTQGMLEQSRSKVINASLPFIGTRGSIYSLPFGNGTFDAALSINVFNHLSDPRNSLLETSRVLKTDGWLLINFANLNSYFWPVAYFINHNHKSVGRDVYSTWLTVREMSKLLEETGFNTVEVVGNVYVPLYLDYPIIREIPILLDRLSRKSTLKWIAPSIFFLCKKR